MDHTAFLIVVLQLCGTHAEGRFVDSIVKLSEKMKLECIYPKKAVIIQTSWMKHNVTYKENIAVLHANYGIHIEDKYKGRIYFENASREDKSLSFIKSTLEDVGLYFCSIATYPDGTWEKVIEVIQPDSDFATYRCVATGRNKTYVMSFTMLATWNHKRFIIYIAAGISAAVLLLVFLWIICIATAYDKKKKRKRIKEALLNPLYSTQTKNIERREEESLPNQTEEIYINCINPRKDH
ncbi:CD226 antigen isoform X2 [Anas platyrhynchos]|uniref:CD226 antigen isoform X2 n=1 Tax=Anas platyrhynchos TaxID=8839 RepID=UPI000A37DB46|nr:CD226 antigen isoform X3 [Anas platyrhynchos]|eukprot:XP_021122682.1 CD226 antigen isoform X2 [Anas platyrhynchos]